MLNFMNYVTPPPQHNAGLEFDNLAKCVYSSVSYLSFDEFFFISRISYILFS